MIFGHKVQLNYFNTLKEKNSLSPSYLFFGKEGIGKFTFAIELAKSLTLPQEILIISRNERVFQKNTNLPWQFFKNSIGIEKAKNLIDFLNLTSFSKKFGIIDEAELLTFEAQNALLKILEEPPKNSHLILITSFPGKLLETVLSRLIKIPFFPLSLAEIEAFLKENFKNLEEEEIKKIAAFSFGSPKKALEILENKEKYFCFKEKVFHFLNSSLKEKLEFLEELEEEKMPLFFEELFLLLEKELLEKKDKKNLELLKKLLKTYFLFSSKKVNSHFLLESFILSF